MASSNSVVVKFLADTSQMNKGIQKVNGQLSGFATAAKGIGVAIAGAFAVGKGIVQFEGGYEYRKYKHQDYNNSTLDGSIAFLSVRWGFLSERLELTYQGAFMFDKLTNKISSQEFVYKRKGFLQNFLGIKYLIYDPFKKEEKINVYSWKANNGFKIKHLIPAVSLTAGANFIFDIFVVRKSPRQSWPHFI